MITQGFAIGTIIAYVITCIVCYVISVIGLAKMFEKAGVAGWKAWIPVYNTYILYKITWDKNVFWAILIGHIGAIVLAAISGYTSVFVSVLLMVILLILYLVLIVIEITALYNISKAYGHGVGFTIGLLFVPIIFYIIIGYGTSEYNRT